MAGVVDKTPRTLSLFDSISRGPLVLELAIEDRDTIDELCAYPAGPERESFALNALRIGVLALRQARGRIDVDMLQQETQRLLASLQVQLDAHANQTHDQLAGALKDYFDPESGRFHERVQRLVKQDGDLEQLLRRQIGGTDSELAKTLVAHVGEQSPLLKLLDPNQSKGLLQVLRETVEAQLTAQRNQVLREFSLDNKEGALARLVAELSAGNGEITKALGEKIDTVVREFSLDEENSALSRLVRNVDRAQRTISNEFSLDNETSALSRLAGILDSTRQAIDGQLTLDGETSSLARLRRELLLILETHAKTNNEFQSEVKVTLAQMTARREEAARSTRHGLAFEEAVCSFTEYLCRQNGDIAERTGLHTGLIKNCKVGDCVIELGPDSAAPGAKIAIEAKEDASCSLAKAREEIELARKNRDAQIGLFVLSRQSAPEGFEDVGRYGDDVFVVWDPDDAATNVHLKAGLTIARALCIRGERQREAQTADFETITEAILEVEKQANFLGEITTATNTIRSQNEKISERVRKTRSSLERQVETLRERIADLKQCCGGSGE
jgi:hypothetical protein